LLTNCLLKQAIEGNIDGRINRKGRWEKKDAKSYWMTLRKYEGTVI
jgi:hypothetical protein